MKHLLVRAESGPGPVLYIARCGYQSGKRKEFSGSGWVASLVGVECLHCLEGIRIQRDHELIYSY